MGYQLGQHHPIPHEDQRMRWSSKERIREQEFMSTIMVTKPDHELQKSACISIKIVFTYHIRVQSENDISYFNSEFNVDN